MDEAAASHVLCVANVESMHETYRNYSPLRGWKSSRVVACDANSLLSCPYSPNSSLVACVINMLGKLHRMQMRVVLRTLSLFG